MVNKHAIVKPPMYLFLVHTLLAVMSAIVIFLINAETFYVYGYILAIATFASGLIFLTIDKNLQSSKNYSRHWTSQVSKVLILVYVALGAYVSWEYGYDLAYERFLNDG